MNPLPAFDRPVARGGYAWWYVDALDREGRFGLAIIGFVGSVFSPYYAWARRHGRGDPLDHCAINVGLYLPRRHIWSMTERSRASVLRTATQLVIGPSAMHWDGSRLRIDINELAVPLPARIRGSIIVHPLLEFASEIALDASGAHRWRPYMPRADVEVAFTHPPMRWRGTAYCDYNHGDTPLEDAFRGWQWTRAHLPANRTTVIYDAQPRVGPARAFGLRIDAAGHGVAEPVTARARLARTGWGLARDVGVDGASNPRILRGLESGPFYARSLLRTTLEGNDVVAMHETLSLDRFAAGWVQALLPFRMPRAFASARSNARMNTGA